MVEASSAFCLPPCAEIPSHHLRSALFKPLCYSALSLPLPMAAPSDVVPAMLCHKALGTLLAGTLGRHFWCQLFCSDICHRFGYSVSCPRKGGGQWVWKVGNKNRMCHYHHFQILQPLVHPGPSSSPCSCEWSGARMWSLLQHKIFLVWVLEKIFQFPHLIILLPECPCHEGNWSHKS